MDSVTIITLGGIVIFFAVVVLGVIIVQGFNVKVVIYEEMGSGYKITSKKARRIEGINGSRLKFLGSKNISPLPDSSFFYIVGPKKLLLNMLKDAGGNLHPMKIRFDAEHKPHIIPFEADARFFHTIAHKENQMNYQNKTGWQQYMPLIAIGSSLAFAGFALVLTLHFYGQYIAGLNSQVGGQMQALTDALKTVGGSVPKP